MNPTYGKRAGQYNKEKKKEKSVAIQFVELNTHHNINMKCKFMLEEDVN
ncbi:MAG TPA: hypothetical protein PK904_19480 [Bacteroidales bacterium]|nr:hypothetical protein [Bacteroidales bacterium]